MNRTKKNYNRIKIVLAEQMKTNVWLAKQIAKNKATISKWCTNEIQPSVYTLFQIADALDIDVKDLLVSNKTK